LALGAGLTAVPAFAGTQAGQIEVGGNAAFIKPVGMSGVDANALLANINVGYFVTDAIEVKGGIVTAYAWGSGNSMYLVGFTAGGDYHFLTKGKLVPYIGGSGGLAVVGMSGASVTGGLVEGHVGLKHFIGERTTINYQVGYERAFVSAFGNEASVGFIAATIGLSYLFSSVPPMNVPPRSHSLKVGLRGG
jgi:hypothetical protein